jgi:peptidoglycan/xylan/chitin deacetylase (PgdA/CDA1 family)
MIGSVNGSASDSQVAVTLDDGPDETETPRLLEVLAAHAATATFFVLVNQVRQQPQLLQRVVAEGHEVGLHGHDHRRITRSSHGEAVAYLRAARAELEQLAGVPIRLYRPPFGSQSLSSYLAARRAGLTVVAWSCDGDDWVDRDVTQVVETSLARLRPGGVLLLHERLEPDPERGAAPVTTFDRAEMLDQVLAAVAQRQWRAVTVSRLVQDASAHRTVWLRP